MSERRVGAQLLDPIRRRVASCYSAGPDLDDVIGVCRRLTTYGLPSIIGYWGDPDESARTVADVHLAAIDRLAADKIDCYVSIKLSRIGFDPTLFTELVAAATRSGVRLHVDALGPETVDPTFQLLERTPRSAPIGTTLPGRYRRSVADAARIVELGLPVRVVKGQWVEGPDSVDASQGFLDVVDALRGHARGVAIATHDIPLLTISLERLADGATPCTVELFFGLPIRGPANVARRSGVPVRIYVAYGANGPPFRTRDLIDRPVTWWWFTQDVFLGKQKTWRSIDGVRAPL